MQAHKYIFDVKGWLLLPGLLSEEELVPIRAHQLAFKSAFPPPSTHKYPPVLLPQPKR